MVGFNLLVIAAEYILLVPLVKPPDVPHEYVAEFLVTGAAGILYMYMGRNDRPTKSP
jgi:hypothetical protein